MSLQPILFNIETIRELRQKKNNELAMFDIINKNPTDFSNINKDEYNRVLKEIDSICKTEKELLDECKNNTIMATILAGRIAIKSSRQGCKDELVQIDICKETFGKCGIIVEKLSSNAFRPVKNGEIINNVELKSRKIAKDICLKSFDAKISGKINGWIFAKIVIGNGGHQDNVFEEADILCQWFVNFGKINELYIILIDTNLIDKYNNIIAKYSDHKHIVIGNLLKVQQYVIDNFYIQ